jgi:hypothetical protein
MVVPDVRAKLPGRGSMSRPTGRRSDKAAKKGLFSRAARMPVKAPTNLADLVEALLARRVVELLSMARKAGQAVTGYEKVKDWLVSGHGGRADPGQKTGRNGARPSCARPRAKTA